MYQVEAILRACTVLKAFQFEGELLRLRDLQERTGMHKATLYRTLLSLVDGGLVERAGSDHFRSCVRLLKSDRLRIGYAAQTSNSVFATEVTESIREAALEKNIELIEVDNRYSAKTALRMAKKLANSGVDVAIEFQTFEEIASQVAGCFREASIPLIAVDIPHPGAVYYGANNHMAGKIGGRALGRYAQRQWKGHVDAIVMLGLPAAGALPQSRIAGMLQGIREVLPHTAGALTVQLDSKGGYEQSIEVTRRFLRQNSAERVLVGAINDPAAIGALRAFEETGRAETAAIAGQGGSAAARAELRRRGTRFIGSVAYFPEKYGPPLIALALQLLQQKSTPPRAMFVPHELLTAENVERIYPEDAQLGPFEMESLLLNY